MYKYILRTIYTNIYFYILVYTQKTAASDVITIKKIQEQNFLTPFTEDTEISKASRVLMLIKHSFPAFALNSCMELGLHKGQGQLARVSPTHCFDCPQ